MRKISSYSTDSRGTIIVVVVLVALMMALGLGFMARSTDFLSFSGFESDNMKSRMDMEAGYEQAKARLDRAVDAIVLESKLPFINGLPNESFFQLQPYYENNEMQFLRDIVEAQSYDGVGTQDVTHEFADFNSAFPAEFTDPDPTDDELYEYRYSFDPLPMRWQAGTDPFIIFKYAYTLEARGYGEQHFSVSRSVDAGVITIQLEGAPFSQWSLFRSQSRSPSGANLYLAGGDTSAQIQEVFFGPVHINGTPNFYGHPVFKGPFTSSVASGGAPSYPNWNLQSGGSYSGAPIFEVAPTSGTELDTSMPSEIFNTLRLAAGDTSPDAATNNSPVSSSDLESFLSEHAFGSLGGPVANEVYIPVNNQTDKKPSGGIYVHGSANVRLNVVQGEGSSDIPTDYFVNIDPAHQACKFQKISIDHQDAGIASRDVLIGEDSCDVTYVFNSDSPTSSPVKLAGRINGNIHVSEEIPELGGESRTRPAIAQDFSFTVSAMKDVKIKTDLQYEDAEYVSLGSGGAVGSTVVADPRGITGDPTQPDLAARIDADSKTILGIMSIKRNVKLHQNAVANLNVHGSIYAGNSAAYDSVTGYGCGSSHAGCGFGVEGWDTVTGRGNFKLFGGVSEFRSQITGSLSSGTGYQRRYVYDTRLQNTIMPPAFAISDFLQATSRVERIKTWRVSRSN